MRKIVLLILITMFLIGCSDKKADALNDLEAMTEQLTTETSDFTQDDWDVARNQFNQICEELEQYDFTDQELKHISELKGKCTAVFARKKASDFKNDLHRMGQEVKGFLDGFTKEMK